MTRHLGFWWQNPSSTVGRQQWHPEAPPARQGWAQPQFPISVPVDMATGAALAQERGETLKVPSLPWGAGAEQAFPQAQQPCLIKDATELLTENKRKVFSAVAFLPSVSAQPATSPRNGCDMASPHLGLQGADPVSLPAGCTRRRQPGQPPWPADACWHRPAMGEEAGHPAEPLPWDNTGFYQVSLHCSRGQQTHSALSPLPAHVPALCLSFPTRQKSLLESPLWAAQLLRLLKLQSDWPAWQQPLCRAGRKAGRVRDGFTEHGCATRLGAAADNPPRVTSRRSARESSQVSPVRHDRAHDGAPAYPSCRHTIATPVPPRVTRLGAPCILRRPCDSHRWSDRCHRVWFTFNLHHL